MKALTGGLISLITHKVHSFSAMKAPTRGLISLFTHKVHSFSPDGSGYAGRGPEK
jgi:hypothetical protein